MKPYVALCAFSLSSLSSGNKFLHLQKIKCHLSQREATMQLWVAKEIWVTRPMEPSRRQT